MTGLNHLLIPFQSLFRRTPAACLRGDMMGIIFYFLDRIRNGYGKTHAF